MKANHITLFEQGSDNKQHWDNRGRTILLTGLAGVMLVLLFPPWKYVYPEYSIASPGGRRFFLSPPPIKSPEEMFGNVVIRLRRFEVRVDTFRLIIEISAIVFLSASLMILIRQSKAGLDRLLGGLLLLAGWSIIAFYIFHFIYSNKTL